MVRSTLVTYNDWKWNTWLHDAHYCYKNRQRRSQESSRSFDANPPIASMTCDYISLKIVLSMSLAPNYSTNINPSQSLRNHILNPKLNSKRIIPTIMHPVPLHYVSNKIPKEHPLIVLAVDVIDQSQHGIRARRHPRGRPEFVVVGDNPPA